MFNIWSFKEIIVVQYLRIAGQVTAEWREQDKTRRGRQFSNFILCCQNGWLTLIIQGFVSKMLQFTSWLLHSHPSDKMLVSTTLPSWYGDIERGPVSHDSCTSFHYAPLQLYNLSNWGLNCTIVVSQRAGQVKRPHDLTLCSACSRGRGRQRGPVGLDT